MRASNNRGFTLAEVLMAVALLGAMAIGITGLFNAVVSASAKSRDTLQAHHLVTDKMEECLDLGYSALSPGTTVETSPAGNDEFSRRTVITVEKAGLLRVDVWAGNTVAADSLVTILAGR